MFLRTIAALEMSFKKKKMKKGQELVNVFKHASDRRRKT